MPIGAYLNPSLIPFRSDSGYVNIYTWDSVMKELTKRPKPLKSVGNLVTAVDQLRFHPFGQMLYMSSSLQPGAAKLVSHPRDPLLYTSLCILIPF